MPVCLEFHCSAHYNRSLNVFLTSFSLRTDMEKLKVAACLFGRQFSRHLIGCLTELQYMSNLTSGTRLRAHWNTPIPRPNTHLLEVVLHFLRRSTHVCPAYKDSAQEVTKRVQPYPWFPSDGTFWIVFWSNAVDRTPTSGKTEVIIERGSTPPSSKSHM